MSNISEFGSFVVPGNWSKDWSLHVLPKIKSFLWRAAPTRSNMQTKGVIVPITCPRRPNEIENARHTFISCSYAQDVWREAGLLSFITHYAHDSEGFFEWFFKVLEHGDELEIGKIAMLLWGLWHSRNEKVRNSKLFFIRLWIFSACRSIYRVGIPSVQEAEVLCLLEAVHWILDMGMDKVIFETDSKVVADVISVQKSDLSEFGSIIGSCKSLLRRVNSSKVCFVKRQANNVAHAS
ncbi:hypothetical protein PTKIN_Ptkin06aG0036200 [Pterospermum kingtungense]